MDTLKTHVSDEEARLSADDVVERWTQLDRPGREAFLNGVRFTEMRGGALLAYLAESVAFDKDARKNIMRQARDEGARECRLRSSPRDRSAATSPSLVSRRCH